MELDPPGATTTSLTSDPLPEAVPVAPAQARLSVARTAGLGFAGTAAILVGAVMGGQSFETHLAGAWYFGMPGGLFGSYGTGNTLPPVASLALVFGGLILLTRVWLGFLRYLRDNPGFPVRRVVFVAFVWAIPLLLAPPLFSRDVYTYAAQGEMMSHHIDPYAYGPSVLGGTSFNEMADTVWSGTESPYGPTFLAADGSLDQASGHQLLPDLVLLRLLEVGGVALMVAATPTLARSLKRDPAHAVLLGAGSPLVLLSLVAGAHNDALMIGLLMAGLAVAKRVGTVPGIILCALAMGVKSPAALGVLFLGWVWAGPDASTRRRIGQTALAGLIALATLEVMSLVAGVGWGWIRTTTTADASFTGITPINLVARAVSIGSHVLQVPISTMDARPVFSVLGLLIAAYVGYRLLMRAPQDGVVRCLGLTLLVLALLGPIVWAWYVTWGVVVLAPAAVGRLRTALVVISTFWAFVGMTSVHNIYMRLLHTFVLTDLLLVALLAAIVITPLGLFRGDGRARLPRLTPGVLTGPTAGATT
ncbi:MAG TPA: polyprenol phosphomannose-dependent alpha 1,6 mannosyltransferase MptB [Acidimicrobiales bacterium]|nr:polyprenol phosphomannose-dependent alpha 1,6 mannosyltransferase MptB [Acidimicrobiales bacterium]